MGYTQALKSEILPSAATWMGLVGIMLSEVSQRERDKYCVISLICGNWKIQNSSEYFKEEADLRDTEHKLVVISGGEGQYKD